MSEAAEVGLADLLYRAASQGDEPEVRDLLRRSSSGVNLCKADADTALHVAVRKGHRVVVEQLLLFGMSALVKDADGQTPLHHAVKHDQSGMVQMLVERGVPVNVADNAGRTPLHVVAEVGFPDVLLFLLDHLADLAALDNRKWTALHYAVANNHDAVVNLLLQKGADVNAMTNDAGTPLHIACSNNNLYLAQLLFSNKADLNAVDGAGRTALHIACANQHDDIIAWLLKEAAQLSRIEDAAQMTPLNVACSLGRVDLVQQLINAGAITSTLIGGDNRSALITTCEHMRQSVAAKHPNYDAVIALLLTAGAFVDARQDETLLTPLMLAAQAGNVKALQILIDAGAQIGPGDKDGATALHHAVVHSQKAVISILIRNFADIDEGDAGGRTPLHYAAQLGLTTVAADLIEHGATVDAKDDTLNTPLVLAITAKYLETSQFLLAMGANPVSKNAADLTPSELAPDDIAPLVHQMFKPALDLQNRQLLNIPPAALQQTRAFVLRLDNNCLQAKSLSELTWAAPALLTGLFLDRNVVFGSVLASTLAPLKSLLNLSLVGCNLTSKDIVGITGVSTLRVLNLNENALQDLPAEFSKLQQLRRLGLAHCSLSSVPSILFEMIAIASLDLRGNLISSVPLSLTLLPNLTHINLGGCHLQGTAAYYQLADVRGLLPFLYTTATDPNKSYSARVVFLGHRNTGKTTLCSSLFPPKGILSKRSPNVVNKMRDVWQERLCELDWTTLTYSRPISAPKTGTSTSAALSTVWETAGTIPLARSTVTITAPDTFSIVCDGDTRPYEFKCNSVAECHDWYYALVVRTGESHHRQPWVSLRSIPSYDLDQAIANVPPTAMTTSTTRLNRVPSKTSLTVTVCDVRGQQNVLDGTRFYMNVMPTVYIITWTADPRNNSAKRAIATAELRMWLQALQLQLTSAGVDPQNVLVYIVGTHAIDVDEQRDQLVATVSATIQAIQFTLPHRIALVDSLNPANLASLHDMLLADLATRPSVGEDLPQVYSTIANGIIRGFHLPLLCSLQAISSAAKRPHPSTHSPPTHSAHPHDKAHHHHHHHQQQQAQQQPQQQAQQQQAQQQQPLVPLSPIVQIEQVLKDVHVADITRHQMRRVLDFLSSRGDILAFPHARAPLSQAIVHSPEWFIDDLYAGTVHRVSLQNTPTDSAARATNTAIWYLASHNEDGAVTTAGAPQLQPLNSELQLELPPSVQQQQESLVVCHNRLFTGPLASIWSPLLASEDSTAAAEIAISALYALELALPWDDKRPGVLNSSLPFKERSTVFPASLPVFPPKSFDWLPILDRSADLQDKVHVMQLGAVPLGLHGLLLVRLAAALDGFDITTSWRCGFVFVRPKRSILVTVHDDMQRIRVCVRGEGDPSDVFNLCFGSASKPGIVRQVLKAHFSAVQVVNYFVECPCNECRTQLAWYWRSHVADVVAEDKQMALLGRRELWQEVDASMRVFVHAKGLPHEFPLEDVHGAQRRLQEIDGLACAHSKLVVPLVMLVAGIPSRDEAQAASTKKALRESASIQSPAIRLRPSQSTAASGSSRTSLSTSQDRNRFERTTSFPRALSVVPAVRPSVNNKAVMDTIRQLYTQLDDLVSTRRLRLNEGILQLATTFAYYTTLIELLATACIAGHLLNSYSFETITTATAKPAGAVAAFAVAIAPAATEEQTATLKKLAAMQDFGRTLGLLEKLGELLCSLRLVQLFEPAAATSSSSATTSLALFGQPVAQSSLADRIAWSSIPAVRSAQNLAWTDVETVLKFWMSLDQEQFAQGVLDPDSFAHSLVMDWQVAQNQNTF